MRLISAKLTVILVLVALRVFAQEPPTLAPVEIVNVGNGLCAGVDNGITATVGAALVQRTSASRRSAPTTILSMQGGAPPQ